LIELIVFAEISRGTKTFWILFKSISQNCIFINIWF
jgi:hypothetical protein